MQNQDRTNHEQQQDLIQALAHALSHCNDAGFDGERLVARINLSPIAVHGMADGWKHCHSVDLTVSGLIEALKMLGAMPAPARIGTADNLNTDAVDFARTHSLLAAEIADVFNAIDARQVQASVLDHRAVDMPVALEAIDDMLGNLADPYADEDES
ncbi:hypothetical protein ACFW9D_05455 [Streptomyces sp. NPDC059524]|uniref:hypothetical protein n=1 Tax=Streptomyces sp. NPDC059524 TaxID=3346856 RepID=UPI0036AC1268